MPKRISVWILGDQLVPNHPALQEAERQTNRQAITILMIESRKRAGRLPYQRKKLVLLFSAMRHYAEALRIQGWTVDYRSVEGFHQGLAQHIEDFQPEHLIMVAGAEAPTRHYQTSKLQSDFPISAQILPNQMFLVERFSPYPAPTAGHRYVMEYFYREMRRHYQVLIDEAGQPIGGQWNFDQLNRKRLPRDIQVPNQVEFAADAITSSVIEMVNQMPGVGSADGFRMAVTASQAEAAFQDFLDHRLPAFGDYEDAMSVEHAALFHSQLSPYMNIGLLEPLHMIREAERCYHEGKAPINAVEGFIRQILGWREFMYWRYWQQMPELRKANAWKAERPMPRMFWDGDTPMRCIHTLVQRLQDTGYTHHIERLMVICNFCMLAGIRPEQVADWFLSFYIDAYEWVVLPNVIGMGLNADDGQIATKPYIASANYINEMGDYCRGCCFDPKVRTGDRACPFNYLYWNFLIAQEQRLRKNPRFGKAVLGLSRLNEEQREKVCSESATFLKSLEYYE